MKRIASFIKKAHFIALCTFMLTGCIEEYNADLPEGETNLLVVSGTILSNGKSEFFITRSVPLKESGYEDYHTYGSNHTYRPNIVYNAKVTICGTDGTEYECRYQNGNYSYITPSLNTDVSYYIRIECEGDVYESKPEKPIRTPDIKELEYYQKGDGANIEILLSTAEPDDPSKTTYYTWNYTETWEVRPTRHTEIYYDVEAKKSMPIPLSRQYPERGWKTQKNTTILTESTAHYADGQFTKYQILDIPYISERVSWNYCNELTQRAISKGEYEYNKACLQAGWEMGGLFTPQPSALPSNIHCTTSKKRALGYIGCAQNVVSKRLYIDGTKIYRELPRPGGYTKLTDCIEADCEKMVYRGMVLYIWEDSRLTQGTLTTYWGYPEDFDVRLNGATTEKPYYMPPFD